MSDGGDEGGEYEWVCYVWGVLMGGEGGVGFGFGLRSLAERC